jgi:hypothetical protein
MPAVSLRVNAEAARNPLSRSPDRAIVNSSFTLAVPLSQLRKTMYEPAQRNQALQAATVAAPAFLPS